MGEEACIATALLSALASAPSTRPRRVCPRSNTKDGTELISNVSEMSDNDSASASTRNTKTALYFFASSCTTSFICLHGSAHGAQKLMSETRSSSALRRPWKCSVEVTSTRFVGADMMEGTEGQVDRVTKSPSTHHAILRYYLISAAINGISVHTASHHLLVSQNFPSNLPSCP